jgi:hypothetical protein
LGHGFFLSNYVIDDLVNGSFLTLPKWSLLVHAFCELCCQGKKLLVIGTTSEVGFLDSVGICDAFSITYHVPTLKTDDAKKVNYFQAILFLSWIYSGCGVLIWLSVGHEDGLVRLWYTS